ncbi:MAG: efflux RND transporter periplasmic adaptor subunit [Sedimentisphaerales bacterium]|nr:efflux RND transporter periplasmic adaptor subunit [Sedimentisphaerales bacterium]
MRTKQALQRALAVVLLAGGGLVAGYLLAPAATGEPQHAHDQAEAGKTQKWYCSMHPQIIRDEFGRCPLCDMDLIPMPESLAVGGSARELAVSEAAAKLMEIQTSPAQRKFVSAEVRMVGKVDYDETRVKHITAWVGGRLDRLYVDFTGISVSEGDHLVYLYSPELISAQAELLQAARAARNVADGASEYLSRSTTNTLEAAREKLRLLGLKADQIDGIEQSGRPLTHLTVYSPMGGVVIEKMANEGMYVKTGTHIYTVADLSQVWVKLDAYESDLPWIRYGQPVEFAAEAYPGEVFKGWVSFIEPTLNAKTRTVKVRVNVPNPEGRLKPEMFVRAVLRSQVAPGGKAMDPNMAGKWMCPMHPSVVKAATGSCDICGMDLVATESLGYVASEPTGEPPLVIPASAPLITGKRAVVYVRKPETEIPTFEGREVILGPRAGAYYLVESGLQEGEEVVTHGSFKIDSALQIQAKPSMMNPEGGAAPAAHQHGTGDAGGAHQHQ